MAPGLHLLVPAALSTTLFFIAYAQSWSLGPLLVAKCLPAVFMGGVVLLAGPKGAFARTVGVGLLVCAAGDLCMGIYYAGNQSFFLYGLGTFLVGHLIYIFAFAADAPRPSFSMALPFVGFGVAVVLFLQPGIPAQLQLPVTLYATAIMAMGWRAAARIGAANSALNSQLFATLGALLFVSSDLMIALDKFRAPLPLRTPLIMSTYYAAQLLIAAAALVPAPAAVSAKKQR